MKLGLMTALLFAGTVTGTVAAQSELSLDDCINIALNENPTIKVADMEIERMDYSKKEVLGQLFPSISFGAQYNRMIAKQVAYMNMDGFGGMGGGNEDGDEPAVRESVSQKGRGSGIKMGLDNSFSAGFNATMPLIAPQLWKSMKLSDSQILQTVEQARSSRIELVNQVKSAYYTLLLAKDSKRVIQESYDMAALTHEIYVKQHAAGAASDYDVLRTSVAMKNVEPDLLQADIALKQAILQLKVLMGVDVTFSFDVTGCLADYESTMYEETLAINPDYSANSSLVMNELQTRTLRNALSVQQMSWLPTLALTANYNWTSSSNGSPLKNFRWDPYSVIGITLSVPLFEGGQRYSKVKQAKLQVQEMEWQRQNLERTVSMQVDLAIDNIKKNVKQISSSSESVRQADKAHDIMERSFQIGAASYLDLRDSELALTQARLSYYQAIYNYLVANSELELLLGNAPVEKYNSVK